jgi:hypothetical protein
MIVIVTGEKQHNKDEYTESSPLHAPGKEHMASPAETVTPVKLKQVPVRADVMPFFLCVSSLRRGMLIFSVSFQFYRMSWKRLMPFQIYMFQVLALCIEILT